jgi:predicted adenine nucleotide alpha hydrolase (AANH) superfamily ATPase
MNKPKLLLHACCAPCLTYSLEYLAPDYDITVYFYNPNIMPDSEYDKRLSEVSRLIGIMGGADGEGSADGEDGEHEKIRLITPEYDNEIFRQLVTGLEGVPEGGRRCEICIRHRLEKTAEYAKNHGYDLFSTTLTISPHKNASFINNTQAELEALTGVKSLPLNLKKKGGYLRSIELSKKYELYRQNYCGCK